MSLDQLDQLARHDFDNGATLDAICTVIKQRDALREALEAVEPFVDRWHGRMAQLIGDTYDQAEQKFSLAEAGFFQYIEEARHLRTMVRAALAAVEAENDEP